MLLDWQSSPTSRSKSLTTLSSMMKTNEIGFQGACQNRLIEGYLESALWNVSARFNPNHRLILVLLNSLAETEEACFQRLGHELGCERLRSLPGFMNWIVTWLILPVVICLSQRLSHACLSINKFILWNCEWLIKSVIVYLMVPCYMDNCGNSRANTCWKAPTSGRGVFIR